MVGFLWGWRLCECECRVENVVSVDSANLGHIALLGRADTNFGHFELVGRWLHKTC